MSKGKKVLTVGVYDLLHIGHVELFRKAKERGDYLIVAVQSSEYVKKFKPDAQLVYSTEERCYMVRSIRYVDEVVVQDDLDKFKAWEKYHYDVLFVGDDWKGTDKWNEYERKLNLVGAKVCYLPYTKTTSSTLITKVLKDLSENTNLKVVA